MRRVADLDDLLRERVEVEDENALGERGRARVHRDLVTRNLDVGQRRVEELELLQMAGVEVDAAEPGANRVRVNADDLVRSVKVIEALAEHPLRRTELRGTAAHRLVALATCAVEVPPVVAVGDEVELAAGRPLRLEHRLVFATRDLALGGDVSVAVELADPHFASVPRHVGVIPRLPRQAHAIGA